MLAGTLAALSAAVAFGVAALLQAVAARREERTPGVDPRLLLRLLRQPVFLVAVGLNLAGFGLHLAALRTLPLFLAQAVIAGSVAVTAVLATRVLGARLGWPERAAVAAVCLGLAALTAAARHPGADAASEQFRLALLPAGAAVALVGFAAGRVQGPLGASLLGLLSGLGFAIVGVAARVLPGLSPATVLADPATYALLGSGAVAFLLYSTALQRGAVMTATSALVLTQTAAPAAVGVLALGDDVRAGWAPVAVAGFGLALAGALTLTRRDPAMSERPPRAVDRPPEPRPG